MEETNFEKKLWQIEWGFQLIFNISYILLLYNNILDSNYSVIKNSTVKSPLTKGLFNLAQACIVDGDFWVPNEIDSWNFQHMLLFWFREASQNLSLFRQLFFHSFQGGTKGKMLKNQCIVMAIFQHFSFGPPLETMKKKVV